MVVVYLSDNTELSDIDRKLLERFDLRSPNMLDVGVIRKERVAYKDRRSGEWMFSAQHIGRDGKLLGEITMPVAEIRKLATSAGD